jgi:hypothetical protein
MPVENYVPPISFSNLLRIYQWNIFLVVKDVFGSEIYFRHSKIFSVVKDLSLIVKDNSLVYLFSKRKSDIHFFRDFSCHIYIIITTVNSFYNGQWMPYITRKVQTFIRLSLKDFLSLTNVITRAFISDSRAFVCDSQTFREQYFGMPYITRII